MPPFSFVSLQAGYDAWLSRTIYCTTLSFLLHPPSSIIFMSMAPMEMYPIVGPIWITWVWRQLDTLSPILLSEATVTIETKKEQIIFIFHTILQPERVTWTKYQTWSTCWCDFDSILLPFLFYNSTPPSTLPFPPWPWSLINITGGDGADTPEEWLGT